MLFGYVLVTPNVACSGPPEIKHKGQSSFDACSLVTGTSEYISERNCRGRK